MPLIPFPNVPKLPGVPQLPRLPGLGPSVPPILGVAAALGALWRAVSAAPQWGIFKQVKSGGSISVKIGGQTFTNPLTPTAAQLAPVVTPDSIEDFGYRNEYELPNFFVQDGSFANYNKVANPFEPYVRMTKTGSKSDRAAFLQQCEDILASIDLYYILTPERTYTNVNPYRMELTRRGTGGAYRVDVDLYFQEIRAVTAQYTTTAPTTQNAQDPSATPVQNNGLVNGDTPTNPPDVSDVVSQK
jgi:hypothetical protein